MARIFPFPRLHFFIPSLAPIVRGKSINVVHIRDTVDQILISGYVRQNYAYPNNIQFDLLQYEHPLYQDIMYLLYKTYTNRLNDSIKFKNLSKKCYCLELCL